MEISAIQRDSRVCESEADLMFVFSSRPGHEKSWLNPAGPPAKAKHNIRSIVNKYSDGKVKRTPGGE